MKKYILIRAFLRGNLGDDLFVRTLCQKMKTEKFIIIAPQKYNYLDTEKNLTYINSDTIPFAILSKTINMILTILRFFKIYKKNNISREIIISSLLLPRIKKVVYITGSGFIENNDFSNDSVKLQEDKWLFNLKPIVIGANFGPYRNNSFLEIYEKLFAKAEFICFRDKYSYNLFAKKLNNVFYSPDVLLGYNYQDRINLVVQEKEYIFISVVDLYKDHDENYIYKDIYIDFLKKVINFCIQRNLYVILAGFSREQGDNLVIEQLKKEVLADNMLKVVCYPNVNENEMLQAMRNAKGIIATRYHAMIFSLVFRKPVFVISYSQKIDKVIEDINFPENSCVRLKELYTISEEQVVSKLLSDNSTLDMEELIKESNIPFQMLRDCLEKK